MITIPRITLRLKQILKSRLVTALSIMLAILVIGWASYRIATMIEPHMLITLASSKHKESRSQTPLEQLLSHIPEGCVLTKQARVIPSIFNSGIDTVVTLQCIE